MKGIKKSKLPVIKTFMRCNVQHREYSKYIIIIVHGVRLILDLLG